MAMKNFLAIALCCATGAAFAQTGSSDGLRQVEYPSPRGDLVVRYGQPAAKPAEPKPAFAELDRNGDGSIDENEAVGYRTLANDFEFADKNRDMRISRREFDRW
jgi:hypothetical protein